MSRSIILSVAKYCKLVKFDEKQGSEMMSYICFFTYAYNKFPYVSVLWHVSLQNNKMILLLSL